MARTLSILFLLSLLPLVHSTPVSAGRSPGSEILVIQAGQLIDGTGRAPMANVMIVVESGGLPIKAGEEVIDGIGVGGGRVAPARRIRWSSLRRLDDGQCTHRSQAYGAPG
jgi:hypothetical protein